MASRAATLRSPANIQLSGRGAVRVADDFAGSEPLQRCHRASPRDTLDQLWIIAPDGVHSATGPNLFSQHVHVIV